MPKFNQIKACLQLDHAAGEATMVHGEGGIGKTDMHNQLAAEVSKPIYLLSAELMQPVDMHGVPVPDLKAGVTRWMQPGTLPFVGSDLEPGYIFIDEINRAEKDMQSVLHPLVLAHRVGEHILKPGCIVCAAGNRKIDKAGVNAMQRTFASRFSHYHLEADLEEWIANHASKQAGKNWVKLIQFLRLKERDQTGKGRLFTVPAEKLAADVLAYPNPRSWSVVAKKIEYPESERFLAVSAKVGETAASELESFLSVMHELPSMKTVVASPMTASVPTSPAATFAVAGMIAHFAETATFGNILKYAGRLGAEFEIMVATDVVRRDASLKECAAYIQWALANQSLTV